MRVPHQHPFARTDTSRWAQWWWTTDQWLLGATGALILLGVLLQFGTSPAAAARLNIAWPFHFAVRQTIFAAIGIGVVLATSVLQPRGVRRVAFAVYVLSLLAMLALPFLGHNAKGATRWVEFGGFALLYRRDQVTEIWQGVNAIKLGRDGRVIRMRMIVTDKR